ncbi:aminomethyltransferase family protein [Angustibacter sp. McL0619]|uniref:aminomethyltransferase family protein n=1 Tax=Angustibacter sp. McL0619 TaxID=3415676 RepID=UPI003CEB99DD
MIRTTPFHPRLSQLNTQGLYTHWQGYLSAMRYSHAPKHEYFAVRNGVGLFDTSPLFKYRIYGPDAERLLAGLLVRDIRTCRPGRAQYTLWCDERGFVMEDGVVFRHSDNDFLLTAARPNLGWLAGHASGLRVGFEDVSDAYGVLAVQGPRSRAALAALLPAVDSLAFMEHTPAKVASAAVTLSRTGYTGDLGFEVTVGADDALDVLDAVLEAGKAHSLRPYGEEAMTMLRIEAGLPLVDVEWHNSRLAFTDHERVTPTELGMGWMLRGLQDDDRSFIGGAAIRRELAGRTSRWAAVSVVVDWQEWDSLYRDAGLLPPKNENPLPYESMLYDDDGGAQVGYVTSFMYSPVLQRHIGLARVRPHLAPSAGSPGGSVRMELAIQHHNTTVAARTAKMPLFNPPRKTAKP